MVARAQRGLPEMSWIKSRQAGRMTRRARYRRKSRGLADAAKRENTSIAEPTKADLI